MKSFTIWISNLINASTVGPKKYDALLEVLSFYLSILPFWVVFIHYGSPIDHVNRAVLFLGFLALLFISGHALLDLKNFLNKLTPVPELVKIKIEE